jgi:hypothetical protein
MPTSQSHQIIVGIQNPELDMWIDVGVLLKPSATRRQLKGGGNDLLPLFYFAVGERAGILVTTAMIFLQHKSPSEGSHARTIRT